MRDGPITYTLAATLPDDLYLLWQIFVTVRAVMKITTHENYPLYGMVEVLPSNHGN